MLLILDNNKVFRFEFDLIHYIDLHSIIDETRHFDQATAMVDQACDVLTTAFPDLWYLIQLYLKKRLYPLSEVNFKDEFDCISNDFYSIEI